MGIKFRMLVNRLFNTLITLFENVYLILLGNVVWLNDRMPTKALLDLTRPIRELRHITSVNNDELNDEDGVLNDDNMDQDDVKHNVYTTKL